MYKLEIIAEAKAELRVELAYSRKHWGEAHARMYAKETRAKIQGLRKQPLSCPLRNDILLGIRILNYRGNRIIYTIIKPQKRVGVLAVLGNAQHIDANSLEKRVGQISAV